MQVIWKTITAAAGLVVLFVLGTALLTLGAKEAQAQFTAKWLDVGDFHHNFSQIGYRNEGGGRGWFFPTIRFRQHHMRGETFWIGVKNWTDPRGDHWPYYTSRIGPRPSGLGVAFPVEQTLTARWEDSFTNVDGVASFARINPVDEIDPNLPADRMVETIWNMDVGVTIRMRAYGFSNAYHDNYHIVEHIITNTGNTDDTPDVNLPGQRLEDLFVFYGHRWQTADQSARVGDNAQEWGRYTMLDVVGDGHREAPLNLQTGEQVDFLGYYGWHGQEQAWTATWGSNLGGPLFRACCSAMTGDTVGRLSGGDFNAEMVLYAPNSSTDPSWDPLIQPRTISYMDSDEALTGDGHPQSEYYNNAILAREKQFVNPDISPSRSFPHYAWLIEPDGVFWGGTNDPSQGRQGGHKQTVGYGPYDLEFGESVRILTVRAIGSLSWDAQLHIGRAYKLSGNDDAAIIEYDANGDGEITCMPFGDYHGEVFTGNECMTKNQWVMTVRDSVFKTFYRARDVFERMNDLTTYPIPMAPYPPKTFDVFGRPDQIELRWEPIPGGETRVGWEIYRTYNRSEWSPQIDGIRLGANARAEQEVHRRVDDRLPYTCVRGDRPGCLGPMLPPDATAFDDTGVTRGTDYFYYLVAVGQPQPNDPSALTGTPGGVPLRSSRYFAQTYQPANLKRPPYGDPAIPGQTGTVADARVVPNPVNIGSDQSIRFSREDRVAFFNIPGEANITVYTETGELVKRIEHRDGSGDATWNLTTDARQLLVSGIYIAVIEDLGTGERVFRKFTVIR